MTKPLSTDKHLKIIDQNRAVSESFSTDQKFQWTEYEQLVTMPIIDQPYTFLLLSSVIIPATLAVLTLKHRSTLGTRSFAVLMAAVALWAFVSLFEVLSRDPQTKALSYSLKYLFIVMVPLSWFSFGLYYSNRLRELKRSHLLGLCLLPLATLVLLATNPYHHWMFSSLELIHTETYYLVYPLFGPWFWVHAGYSYLLLLLGFFFLGKRLMDSPAPYRRQMIALLIGGLTPWIANMCFIFNLGPIPFLDLTPFAFTISGVAFMWGILKYRLLDNVPFAHDIMIQNMRDGVIVVDNHQRILDLNPAARKMIGMDQNQLIGAHAGHLIPWWPKIPLTNDMDDTLLGTIEINTANQRRWLRPAHVPLMLKNKPIGHLVTLRDVTAIQLAEDALRDSEERFKSLSENAPAIIFSLDQKGVLTYINPAWEKILGHPKHEVLGQPFTNFVSQNGNGDCNKLFKELIDGRTAVAEVKIHFLHKNGGRRLFSASAAANSDTEGRVTGIIGLARDVTEENELQQQLIQSKKMEAIGTLAGGIAHDFNNLLMSIQANISLMQMDGDPSQSHHEKLNRIEEQIQCGASLTRQLLGYARKGNHSVANIRLNSLIEDTLNVVQRTNKKISIRSRLTKESTHIMADQGQIELVLLNLFINAVDAMPNGGQLTVETGRTDSKRFGKQWPSNLTEESYIELKVTDTGMGMDPATKDRIFEPFFTTKAMGQGTGLGLASVYGVVQNHNGHIRVDSNPDEGTVFTLLFPATRKSMKLHKSCKEGLALTLGNGKILLVDDEPLILQYCQEMIQSLGFSVIAAGSGQEAVRIYDEQKEDIDLAIMDMIMPGMDGLQVLEILRSINPQIRVIITSGYAFDSRLEKIVSDNRHGSLRKPYNRDELALAISEILSPRDHYLKNGQPGSI